MSKSGKTRCARARAHAPRLAHRCTLSGLAAALALVAALTAPTAASAAGDPVASGAFELKLSRSFAKKLRRGGAKMTAGSFAISSGSVNPTDGTGSLTLPPLRFKNGRKKVTYKQVTATLGPGGALEANGAKLFGLSGGKVVRNSFGARVSGLTVTLPRKGAKVLNRKLGLDSLSKGAVGTATVSAQPSTVEVTGGTVAVLGFSTSYPGSFAQKTSSHCISPVSGTTALGPATTNGAIPPSYSFPVSGGTISPDGTGGVLNLTGGLRISNKKSQVPGCTAATGTLQLDQSDFIFDFEAGAAKSHLVISGKSSPPNGDQGVQFTSVLDSSNVTVAADPAAKKITATGGVLKLNKGAALYLNQVFPQPSYDWANEFVAGDPMGIVQISLNTR
jgi:hypothetical protein